MRSADVNITFLNECYVTSQNQSADERCLKPHRIKIINTIPRHINMLTLLDRIIMFSR
jgi:hypothetical protein